MLKLKKLQILGFKSFCDRTELKFNGEGIAAIVGPNGCGKSNISDAITWVLGEQSAKTLRGARMEDVIFAGTRDRKATGMAEVSLTLIDPEIYGSDVDEPEIEIRDDMPDDDWDEEALRAAREEDTAAAIAEAQPGQVTEVPGAEGAAPQVQPAEGTTAPAQEQCAEGAATENAEAQPHAETDAAHAHHSGVVLKIRRRKFKSMPLKAGEIVVTRRLFRSGESEYLLNRKLCRLRDIQDIFMGTGLGPESYAIIEQGRIGQILSSKPTDRRNIIEEAAGITKFKTKKRLAEARLEDARTNLNRINDIFEEVTRQMNSLKRQAAKAERYAKLRDQMREKLRLVLASKWTQLQHERESLTAELEAITAQVAERTDSVRAMENEHGECTNRGYELEAAARQVRERLNQIAREIERAETKSRQNEERCAELEARAVAAQQELAATEGKLAELTAERDANAAVLASAAADVAAAQEELAARQAAANQAAQALSQLEREQDSKRGAIMQAANEAAQVRNRITQAEENMASLERESHRLRNEIDAANVQLESFGGERGQLGLEFASASKRAEELAAQIGDARQQLATKRTDEVESKRRLDGLRAEYATAMGKKSSLESVIAEHGYSTDSVRRLFRSGALQGGHAPVGVLADFLDVEDRYENVVDDFLREELNYVVVKSWDAASEGLNLLRTDVEGRATFLVHPNDSQAKFPFIVDEATQFNTQQQCGIVPLKNCIRVLDGFGKSLEMILPKLGNGYIVPSPEVGRELALSNPDAYFLANNGECFHNVTVTGGKQRAEGPLAMKRELRDIMRQMAEIERGLRDEQTRVMTLGKDITELTGLVERLEADRREAEKQAMTSGHTLKQLDAEMARVRQRLETYERELARVGSERGAREAFIAEKQAELEQREARRAELEQSMATDQQQLVSLREARDTAAQNASEARANMAALEERRRAAQSALQRIEALVNEVAGRVRQLEGQISGAANEKQAREAENVRLAEQALTLGTDREAAQAQEQQVAAEAEQVRARVAELDEQLRAARAELDAARDRRGELAAAMAKLESDAAHMDETSVNDLGAHAEELVAQGTPVVENEQLAVEEEAYREMRGRLDGFGAVNMMALEEYNEVAGRHATLETQRTDLIDAIQNTTATIKEIEIISKQKFEEAFKVINENFSLTFTKLFGGGQAFMRLTDEENSAESGIDVVASPPGKKLQNVLLLSGGEKALTALSLLVSIFKYQPSPFCILDEVDAPLDEANIGRFNDLVKEMSMQTQFILITHSKKTMSIAPIMYGVTMQEPGVSKVVSVRFSEAAGKAPQRAASA